MSEVLCTVDFVAGASFYGEGHRERVGESIFLFASYEYEVSTIEVHRVIKGSDPKELEASEKIAIDKDEGDSVAAKSNSKDAINDGIKGEEQKEQDQEAVTGTAP